MVTLRKWFERFTESTGETPTYIVLAWDRDWRSDEWPELPDGVKAWTELSGEILDREFDDGFGGNDSPNLCAWSDSWVIFSDNYDGAESLAWVPREPIAHDPIRPGGG
jgi:hypothetical protein